ncbi:MAG: MBL fold metallo-hydrolase, partial [Bacillota bacterium]
MSVLTWGPRRKRFLGRDDTHGGRARNRLIPTPGHLWDGLSVFVRKARVLFCGDLIYSGFRPTTRFGTPELWRKWIIVINTAAFNRVDCVRDRGGDRLSGQCAGCPKRGPPADQPRAGRGRSGQGCAGVGGAERAWAGAG